MEPISKEQSPIPLWINGKKFEELIDTGNDILIFFSYYDLDQPLLSSKHPSGA